MQLLSSTLSTMLDEIIGKCFAINRFLDRHVSLIDIRWKMPNTSALVHTHLAHNYIGDLFADAINDYKSERDTETIFPETPRGDENYGNILEFAANYHRLNLELEALICDAVAQAVQESDHTTKVFLDGLLTNLKSFIAQSQTLIDQFNITDGDKFKLQVLDENIEKYISVPKAY